MNNRDQRRYERLTRVSTFGRERASDFNPNSKALELLAGIDRALTDLDAAKADQQPSRVDKRNLLHQLMTTCRNITRTAKAIAISEPAFSAPYQPPNSPAESLWLTYADSLLLQLEDQPADSDDTRTAKQALRQRFGAYELDADFVNSLRNQRESMRNVNQQNQGETQDGIESTAMIGNLLDHASDLMQELDAIMINKYQREPEKLKTWRSASRIESAPQRSKRMGTAGGGSGGGTGAASGAGSSG